MNNDSIKRTCHGAQTNEQVMIQWFTEQSEPVHLIER